ncbi:MAG: acyl-phosphate glycerol 3-phosphate acyltransferase [Rickettsiales bacterium]|jgi:acyl phosphate:glycerol-3-phosphate acyltransferase|nr:acyl-phosphate glycerol 3-phosphate acyltransferase [Rickettsiales bacterium]|tara:strand:+ start:596 stop:1186 length:591 start_codon:yes stop_codon:yes gene_type:complete
MIIQILFLLITYLISSIPFGLFLGKLFANIDIREHGSNNIGATNVSRIIGKKLGLATLILDGLKGGIMVMIARFIFHDFIYLEILLILTAAIAVIGHIFPIYINFKGGKGVATSIATIIALDPYIGAAICLIWIIAFILFRISAISSISAIFSSLIISLFYNTISHNIFYFLLFILILYRHKDNIKRLIQGSEKKL